MALGLLLLLAWPTLGHTNWQPREGHARRAAAPRKVPQSGFYDPTADGGSFLTSVSGTYPPGQGEPLNAIISGNSDGGVLVDTAADGGLRNYFLSLGFSSECLGQTDPGQQGADLGDGRGYVNQTAVIRWNYGDPSLGTCRETIQGGNHFRYWVQDGPDGNSGAIFMGISYEHPLALQHDIIPNGYNFGRDWLVGNITASKIPTRNLTNSSTFNGSTVANGYTYQTSIQYISGCLQNTSMGINHNGSVPIDGLNAVDGLVALLTVKITGKPSNNDSRPSITSTKSLLSATFLSLLLLFTH